MADFALEVEDHFALFAREAVTGEPDAGVASSFERLAQAGRGALGCGGRVVQLVGQARRQLAERHQLVALRLGPGGLTDAVCHDGHQALAQLGHPLEHFGKQALVEAHDPSGKHCASSARVAQQPGVRQHAGDLARSRGEGRRARRIFALEVNLTLQDHEEMLQRITLPGKCLTRRHSDLLKMLGKPG